MRADLGRWAAALVAWLVVLAAATVLPAQAEPRIALVITNQAYTQPGARLTGTHRNGETVKAALEKAGFKVTTVRDTRLDGALKKAVSDHAERLKAAGLGAVGVIYFAGQAASDKPDGDTYLIPIDVPFEGAARLPWMGVGLGAVADTVAKVARNNVIIVDGCRGFLVDRRVAGSDPSGCGEPRERAGVALVIVKKPPGAGVVNRFTGRTSEAVFARLLSDELAKSAVADRESLQTLADRIASETNGRQTVALRDGRAPPLVMARPKLEVPPTPPAGAPAPAPVPAPDSPSAEKQPQTRGVVAGTADWDVVPVFYGTNRQPEDNVKRAAYGTGRAGKLELGRALVTVPRAHKVPNLERPWVYKVPFTQVVIYGEPEDPAKHFTLKEVRSLTEAEWLRIVAERLAASKTYEKHALVFIHGFNTTFDYALFRTAQIAYDLKFDGAPFVYSWPSKGELNQIAYNYDRESTESARPHLKSFIELVASKTGATRVSIIAHSMGHQVLMPVLEDIKRDKPQGVTISEVILAAPDMERAQFETLARDLKDFGRGMTLYASANDVALKAAERYWGAGRAGGVPAAGPVVVPGLDTIDVSSTSTDWFGLNHSTYAERTELIDDISKLLRSPKRQRPPQREPALVEAQANGVVYWKYPPRTAVVKP